MSTDYSTSNKLQGKVAIITGGASGIGEATAHCFVNHGAKAIVIADIQDDKGQNVAASIGHNRCNYIHCDVSDEKHVKSLVDYTVDKYGRLDIMFSNAGIPKISSSGDQTVLDLDLPMLDKLFSINVRGMAACVKHAACAMVEREVKGSIICTASILASKGNEKFSDYVMSKHAVLGLVRSASMQLGAYGIRVNCVSPGPVPTALLYEMLKTTVEEKQVVGLVETCQSLKNGKVLSETHVADAVSFLASNESEFVTGHDLLVDGGYVHRWLAN